MDGGYESAHDSRTTQLDRKLVGGPPTANRIARMLRALDSSRSPVSDDDRATGLWATDVRAARTRRSGERRGRPTTFAATGRALAVTAPDDAMRSSRDGSSRGRRRRFSVRVATDDRRARARKRAPGVHAAKRALS